MAGDDTAGRILLLYLVKQIGFCFLAGGRVRQIKRTGNNILSADQAVFCLRLRKGNRTDCGGISEDINPKLRKQTGGDGSGGDPCKCFSAGGTSASTVVSYAVFCVKGIVCMPRTIDGLQVGIIF